MATAQKIYTPVGRVSFPQVFEASSYQGGAPKFSTILVFEPAKFTPADRRLWAAMEALADEASVAAFKKKLAQLPANFKKPFRDGTEKGDLAGFGEGKTFITISSKMRPGIVDLNGNPILDKDQFFPGVWARATITCYAYDNVGKGVAFGMQNLQLVAEGLRLDSRTDASEDFGKAPAPDFTPPATPDDGSDFE